MSKSRQNMEALLFEDTSDQHILVNIDDEARKKIEDIYDCLYQKNFEKFQKILTGLNKKQQFLLFRELKDPHTNQAHTKFVLLACLIPDRRFLQFTLAYIETYYIKKYKVDNTFLNEIFSNDQDIDDSGKAARRNSLFWLTMLGDFESMKKILDFGILPPPEILYIAYANEGLTVQFPAKITDAYGAIKIDENGRKKILELLLERGIDPQAQPKSNCYKRSFIEHVICMKKLEVLKIVVHQARKNPVKKFDIDKISHFDESTPLKYATMVGNFEIVKFLLDARANPNLQTQFLRSTLESHGVTSITSKETFHNFGLHQNYGSWTPLMLAARNGAEELIDLLATPQNINAQNYLGETALEGAAASGHLNIIEKLLALGASMGMHRLCINNAIAAAIQANQLEVVKVLMGKVDLKQNYSETMAFPNIIVFIKVAIDSNQLEILKYLLNQSKSVIQDFKIESIGLEFLEVLREKHAEMLGFLLESFPSLIDLALTMIKNGDPKSKEEISVVEGGVICFSYECITKNPEEKQIYEMLTILTRLLNAHYQSLQSKSPMEFLRNKKEFELKLLRISFIMGVIPIIKFFFDKICQTNNIEPKQYEMAIQHLIKYLIAKKEHFSFTTKEGLVLLFTTKKTTLTICLSMHLKSILDDLAAERDKHKQQQSISTKKIFSTLSKYTKERSVEDKEMSEEVLRQQEHCEAILLISKLLGNKRVEVQALRDDIIKLIKEIIANVEMSEHHLQWMGYYSQSPDLKRNHEENHKKWRDKILEAKGKIQKLEESIFNVSAFNDLENLKNILKKISEDNAILKSLLPQLLALQKEINEQLKKQEEFKKYEAKHPTSKNGGDKSKSKSNSKHKAKKQKSKGDTFQTTASAPSPSLQKKSTFIAEIETDLANKFNDFGSKIQSLETAIQDYFKDLKEAELQSLQKQKRDLEKDQFSEWLNNPQSYQIHQPSHFSHVPQPLTLDRVGQISAKMDIVDRAKELKERLEESLSSEHETKLMAYALAGELAQSMESCMRVEATLLTKVAAAIRNLIFYKFNHEEKQWAELKKVTENVSKFLLNFSKQTSKKGYDTVSDLLEAMDPKPSLFLLTLLKDDQKDPIKIDEEFCRIQIERGLERLRFCQNLYKTNQQDINKHLLVKAMGATFALIGNFASHLRKDFLKKDSKGKASHLYRQLNRQCKNVTKNQGDFGLQTCIVIGRLYRHLNDIRMRDKVSGKIVIRRVSEQQKWENRVEAILLKWKPVSYLPDYHTSIPKALAFQPEVDGKDAFTPSQLRVETKKS